MKFTPEAPSPTRRVRLTRSVSWARPTGLRSAWGRSVAEARKAPAGSAWKRWMRPLMAAAMLLAATPWAGAQCHYFTTEHVDLLSIQWHPTDGKLGLMAANHDQGGRLYASNQCVIVCPESMRFTLPAGTPLGPEGQPLWILAQNPYPDAPFVGVSAAAVPPGSFEEPLTIRLLQVEGPGDFLLWQSVGFGQFDVKMDSRDGLDERDRIQPFVGGHEHHGWGFTTSGVYRLFFQVSGRRPGEATNILSDITPFTFHVQPLRPFESWVAAHWPCECDPERVGVAADPDGDRAPNGLEYGAGTDPNLAQDWPVLTLELPSQVGPSHARLTFTRSKTATDCTVEVLATKDPGANQWEALEELETAVDEGNVERVSFLDPFAAGSVATRFYRLHTRFTTQEISPAPPAN